MKSVNIYASLLIFLGCVAAPLAETNPASFKVLAVMSYEEQYPWVLEIKDGIESVLSESCQIEYFYLNTKVDWEGGKKRAKKAYERYLQFNPDGIIVADDDGQAMFVVPYLKDKVKTPVIFCGVNAEPERYGYPASNVSGVLERELIKETLLLLRDLDPSINTFGYICKNSPTAMAVEMQMLEEKSSYPLSFIGTRTADTLEDAETAARELKEQCDALLFITMEGLPDRSGAPQSDREIISMLTRQFEKPIITNAPFRVKYGALCAVVKTGQEHGRLAAENLLKAMQGTPVSEIPITRNRFGRRIANVDAMEKYNIQIEPSLIRRTELVRTENTAEAKQ